MDCVYAKSDHHPIEKYCIVIEDQNFGSSLLSSLECQHLLYIVPKWSVQIGHS